MVEGGKFKVELYYCCAPKDLGTTMELSMGESKVSVKIDKANESPLIGADQDRSFRNESLVKNFVPVEMGEIELARGLVGLEGMTS